MTSSVEKAKQLRDQRQPDNDYHPRQCNSEYQMKHDDFGKGVIRG
jgi:hypothetical protein